MSEASPTAAFEDGQYLVANPSLVFPAICMKCGRTTDLTTRTAHLTYAPPWVIAVAPFACLVGIFFLLSLQKRVVMRIPLCTGCDRHWNRKGLILFGTGVALTVAVVGSLVTLLLVDNNPASSTLGGTFLGALWFFFVGMYATDRFFCEPRTIWIDRLRGKQLVLAGTHRDARRATVEHVAQQQQSAAGRGWAMAPDGQWYACRILGVTAGQIHVEFPNGVTQWCAADQVRPGS